MSFDKINKLYDQITYNKDNVYNPFFEIKDSYEKLHSKLHADKMHLYKTKEFHTNLATLLKDGLRNNGLMTHMKGDLLIPLNPEWKKIAVNLSGGADSAITTYILASIIEENNYDTKIDILSYHRCWFLRPWQKDVAVCVYEWLKNRFPNIIADFQAGYIMPEIEHGVVGNILEGRSGDQISVSSYNRYFGFQNQYRAVYNATTKNPSVDYDIHDKMKNRDWDINKAELKALVFLSDNSPIWSLSPFKLVEKDWIVQQYIDNNVLDLFLTTRSCEGDSDHSNLIGMDYHWYENNRQEEIPECGDCFWCVERNWAKQKVGLK